MPKKTVPTPIQKILAKIRPVWISRVGQELARGMEIRADFEDQLARFFDLLQQSITTGDPAWMANGSYAVVRRIRMLLDDWEQLSLKEQEDVIGRRKADGAPLSGGSKATETTAMDLEKTDAEGSLLVPINAHARISRPDQNGGAAMLRRPFSFHDGIDAKGVPDAGLLFVCWQADPLRGFVTVQRKLDRGDALSKFIRHESSGLFAVPGGAAEGEYVGQRLLEG